VTATLWTFGHIESLSQRRLAFAAVSWVSPPPIPWRSKGGTVRQPIRPIITRGIETHIRAAGPIAQDLREGRAGGFVRYIQTGTENYPEAD